MDSIFGWPPIVWATRIATLVVLIGCAYVFILLVARFFRWSVVKAMLLADPPQVETVTGEAAGLKGEIRLTRQQASFQDEQIAALDRRVTELDLVVAGILSELATSTEGQTDER